MKKTIFFILLIGVLLSQPAAANGKKAGSLGLPQVLKRMHFVIYHNDRSYANKVSWKAEYSYKKILRHFNVQGFRPWEGKEKCVIYLFENRAEYIKKSKAPEWSGGCARDNPPRLYIYKGAEDLLKNTLPHEITHLIFHELIPRSKIPLWLDEGMAQYEEDKWGSGVFKDYLKDRVKKGIYISFDELFSMKRYPSGDEKISLFYAESASIIDYLRKKQIASLFGKFLLKIRRGKPVGKALSETYYPKFKYGVADLERKWKKYVVNKY
ncbi:MAG: hypothetical protein KAJ66_05850 [Candidatus Omnitrophica bacterium]|nr:hypothetical protein [Candidatus Omnitrophota bacterium]